MIFLDLPVPCLSRSPRPLARSFCIPELTRVVPPVQQYITLTFEVADTGLGMGQEFIQQVFEPYSQENRYRFFGTGLGLPICKKIVQLLGGQITVHSKLNEGAFPVSLTIIISQVSRRNLPGTTFTVYIPVGIPSEPEEKEGGSFAACSVSCEP